MLAVFEENIEMPCIRLFGATCSQLAKLQGSWTVQDIMLTTQLSIKKIGFATCI